MSEKDYKYLALVARKEGFMESGEPIFTLKYLLNSCAGDINYLQQYLTLWQSEDRIDWLKPLNPQNPTAEVVRFKTYITKKAPWPR
jgi:hypothetical protein